MRSRGKDIGNFDLGYGAFQQGFGVKSGIREGLKDGIVFDTDKAYPPILSIPPHQDPLFLLSINLSALL